MVWVPRIAAIVSATFLFAPILIIVPMSFSGGLSFEFPPTSYSLRYYAAYFNSPEWRSVTINSLIVAFGTACCTMALIVPASFGFVRHRIYGRSLMNNLFMAPLIVPHVVTALGDYKFLAALGIVGTHVGLILAHTVLSVPVAFLTLTAALKGFDRNLERAAAISGASPFRAFWYVTLPVLRPGFAVAAFFAFLTSFNESVISIFVAGRSASTLPKKMFESIRQESDPTLAVVSSLLIGLIFAIFIVGSTANLSKRRVT
jgi:putative spermidine/putrescine transport system permease protein